MMWFLCCASHFSANYFTHIFLMYIALNSCLAPKEAKTKKKSSKIQFIYISSVIQCIPYADASTSPRYRYNATRTTHASNKSFEIVFFHNICHIIIEIEKLCIEFFFLLFLAINTLPGYFGYCCHCLRQNSILLNLIRTAAD